MNKDEIISVLEDLHRVSGFRVSLHGVDYEEIAAYPEEGCRFCSLVQGIPEELDKCNECDTLACKIALEEKNTYMYKCHFGLTEAVAPLYNFGTLTGFLMVGQVMEGDSAEGKAEIARLSPEMKAAFDEIPIVTKDIMLSYVKIMTVCARYLTLSNATLAEKPTLTEMAKRFIYDNYSRKIGIRDICEGIGCSKSSLISSFKRDSGVTVNDFLTSLRLSKAESLLRDKEKSICEVAMSTGFSDQSYFSKLFFAKKGLSPSDYRAIALEERKNQGK